ncbi:M1 family metallopeptidase (plasmid) [Streptomyces sp. HUAS TT11]|uniref:M1 family metallopeptidase n=1 Tax=Streptomyces sp. HUAS TT11 TaxID=3447508 RepID=UPI003F65D053
MTWKPMPTNRRAAAMASALLVAAVTACGIPPADAADKAKPGARHAGDRLFRYLGNRGYDVQSYDVRYDYRPDTPKMKASVRVEAKATQALSEFSLDSTGQKIDSVSVDGADAEFRRDAKDEKLIIKPKSPLVNQKAFRVDISFVADRSADPASPADPDHRKGLTGWHNYGKNGKEGFAMLGQPDRGHLFFPMNDHPSDKARVTFRLTTPKDMTAVANGTLQSRTARGERTTYVYATRDVIPTHVVQAAVGHYQKFTATGPGGLPLRSYVAADRAKAAEPQVKATAAQLAWVAQQIGSAYPYETYGILGTQGEFGGVALEGATLSTYAAEALNKPSPVMVHELVHQYFGNAVALKNWDDMWISEGHASYYTARYMDEKGEAKLEETVKRAYEFDRDERPNMGAPGRLKEAGDVLGGTNAAGVVMLHGLRLQVGDATFSKIEKTFFDRFRHKNASTQDYIDVANEVSGRDLTKYVKSWIYGNKTPPMPKKD